MALVDAFDAIIFDYGGVLVAHQTEADLLRMAGLAGIIDTERFTELYWFHRPEYDRGLMTAAEYWAAVAMDAGVLLKEDVIDRLTDADTESWMHFDATMWAWVDGLKRSGKSLAMLSNMPLDLGEALKAQTDRLDVFDQLTLSYEVRAVKPEPAIYDHCLEGLASAPARTLFFDDRIENVQGAELLGIRSIQFVNRDDVLLQVRS
jgi:putative hydrolase of the HAD superfamily